MGWGIIHFNKHGHDKNVHAFTLYRLVVPICKSLEYIEVKGNLVYVLYWRHWDKVHHFICFGGTELECALHFVRWPDYCQASNFMHVMVTPEMAVCRLHYNINWLPLHTDWLLKLSSPDNPTWHSGDNSSDVSVCPKMSLIGLLTSCYYLHFHHSYNT